MTLVKFTARDIQKPLGSFHFDFIFFRAQQQHAWQCNNQRNPINKSSFSSFFLSRSHVDALAPDNLQK
jgi:hypothetical protein